MLELSNDESEIISENSPSEETQKKLDNGTNYKPEELLKIFLNMCEKGDYIVSDELKTFLSELFSKL